MKSLFKLQQLGTLKKYTETKVKLFENKLKHQKLSSDQIASDCPNKLAKLTMQGAAKVSLCDATKEVLSLADVKVMSKVQCCDVYTGKQHVLHSICSSRGSTQITYCKVGITLIRTHSPGNRHSISLALEKKQKQKHCNYQSVLFKSTCRLFQIGTML